MNVPANYDDDIERQRTHPDLLPREGDVLDVDTLTSAAQALMTTED